MASTKPPELPATRKQFMEEWTALMERLGSGKARVPKLGHKELDLFVLYLEVARRGGVAKVIENKQWRAIAEKLKLPDTCTNAGYTLRLNYLKYLWAFEQKYLWGVAEADIRPPDPQLGNTSRRRESSTVSEPASPPAEASSAPAVSQTSAPPPPPPPPPPEGTAEAAAKPPAAENVAPAVASLSQTSATETTISSPAPAVATEASQGSSSTPKPATAPAGSTKAEKKQPASAPSVASSSSSVGSSSVGNSGGSSGGTSSGRSLVTPVTTRRGAGTLPSTLAAAAAVGTTRSPLPPPAPLAATRFGAVGLSLPEPPAGSEGVGAGAGVGGPVRRRRRREPGARGFLARLQGALESGLDSHVDWALALLMRLAGEGLAPDLRPTAHAPLVARLLRLALDALEPRAPQSQQERLAEEFLAVEACYAPGARATALARAERVALVLLAAAREAQGAERELAQQARCGEFLCALLASPHEALWRPGLELAAWLAPHLPATACLPAEVGGGGLLEVLAQRFSWVDAEALEWLVEALLGIASGPMEPEPLMRALERHGLAERLLARLCLPDPPRALLLLLQRLTTAHVPARALLALRHGCLVPRLADLIAAPPDAPPPEGAAHEAEVARRDEQEATRRASLLVVLNLTKLPDLRPTLLRLEYHLLQALQSPQLAQPAAAALANLATTIVEPVI